jgi:hypothetical protein
MKLRTRREPAAMLTQSLLEMRVVAIWTRGPWYSPLLDNNIESLYDFPQLLGIAALTSWAPHVQRGDSGSRGVVIGLQRRTIKNRDYARYVTRYSYGGHRLMPVLEYTGWRGTHANVLQTEATEGCRNGRVRCSPDNVVFKEASWCCA